MTFKTLTVVIPCFNKEATVEALVGRVLRDIHEKISLEEDRFGFDPEITTKISHLKPTPRIFEVGTSYAGRTYDEGKGSAGRTVFA